MGQVGDKYVVTTKCYYGSDAAKANPIQNVFAYEATSGTPTASALWDAFFTHVVSPMMEVSIIGYSLTDATVINLDDPLDFENITSIGEDGAQSGEAMNHFVAWEFEYVRATREVHNGRKAFGGLSEANLQGGVPFGDIVGDLNALAVVLGNIIGDAGLSAFFTPRIWRRAGKYAPYTGDPKVGTSYPDTFYPIAGVTYRTVSTQNSRKR